MSQGWINALIYKVEHGRMVSYSQAEPLEFDAGIFTVHVANLEARFSFKERMTKNRVDEAKALVEPFIHNWESYVAITKGPDQCALKYSSAEIIEDDPKPGFPEKYEQYQLSLSITRIRPARPKTYPEPYLGFHADLMVDVLQHALYLYETKHGNLAHLGNMCDTVVRHLAWERGAGVGTKKQSRDLVPHLFHIHRDVMQEIGRLCAHKGGMSDARKGQAIARPFTQAERRWLERAAKAVILRVGEFAADAEGQHEMITMGALNNDDDKKK